jgi:RNA polymerase sigma factor (sigma-70 family)
MPDAPLIDLVTRLRDLAAEPGDGVADADLLRRYVQDRDAVAFEALVWRHARLVMGVCRRTLRHHQDAEDAFQATFLMLARKAHRVRRGEVLPAWLHTTAVRVARRARNRRRPVPVSQVPEQPTTDPLPESAEACAILDAEISRLPARLQAAFVLCGLEGRSHADAARELGCPKGTIDSRMVAAKHRLKAALARRGVTLAPVAALVAAVPELAYSEAARRAAVLSLSRPADVSPGVAGLLAPTGRSRWVVGVAAAVTLAAAGAIATLSGMAGTGDPPKPPADRTGDEHKTPERTFAAERHVPGMKPLFKRTTIGVPEDLDAERQASIAKWLQKLYAGIIEERRKAGKPLFSPAVPAGDGDRVIYANDMGIVCFSLTEQKTDDPPVKPGDFLWVSQSDTWIYYQPTYSGGASWLDPLLNRHGPNLNDLITSRTLSRTFTRRAGSVELIDELAILPTAEELNDQKKWQWSGIALRPSLGPDYWEVIRTNAARVVDTQTGKLITLLGRNEHLVDKLEPFGGGVYLGAPLPIGDDTIIIQEKNKRLRVTSVSWDKVRKASGDSTDRLLSAANATFLWDAELVTSPTSVVADPHRRIHAIHLAKAGDLIICPTHLGRVVAVEAKNGKVKWTHEYAALAAKRFSTFAPEWIVVPPIVAGDKYIYAPADFPELLCLNVADGKKVWSAKKGDGLYPAVVGDQVLVVGEKTLRSLNLKDGTERWKVDLPGLPCGRGAALGETYLVPVSEPKTWRGMIAVVDLKAGKVAEVLKPEKEEPIGNLVVHKDFLISQTLTEIAVFPIRKKE